MGARGKRWLLGLGITLGLLAALVFAFDWNWVKGPIEQRVSAQTGREFSMEDLHVRLWPPARVRVRGLSFANPAWAAEPHMIQLAEGEAMVRLLPLLRGELVFPEIRLVQPRISLERSAEGENNWTLARDKESEKSGDDATPPVVGRLIVDDGRLAFRDPGQKTALELAVETLGGAEAGLKLRAGGRYRGMEVDAKATGDPVLALAETETPYALDGRFRIGPTRGTIAGSITGLAAFAGADLRLDVRGNSLAELYTLMPVSLPPTPPYHIKGRLLREADTWRFHDIVGMVGDSDLSGDADITRRNGRLHLMATLTSQLFDFNDLGGLIGGTPGTGRGETASPQQERAARQAAQDATVLPDKEFKLDRLRAMDATVAFTGQAIRGNKTPLDDVELKLELKDGLLTTAPLNFGVAGGNVISTLEVDARRQPLDVDGEFEFRRIKLGQLFPQSELAQRSTGLIAGRAALSAEGNSFADLLAAADGNIGLAMTGGRVSNLLLEAVGLDAAEVLRFLFRGDKTVELRCAVADLAVQDGVVQARSMVVDTTDTNIKVEGQLSLAEETLDLTLHPLPKDYSPLSLRSPLHIEGTFKDPQIELDDSLLLRGGVAAALATLAAPLAALIPLLERGPGDDVNCERLVAAVREHAPDTDAAAFD